MTALLSLIRALPSLRHQATSLPRHALSLPRHSPSLSRQPSLSALHRHLSNTSPSPSRGLPPGISPVGHSFSLETLLASRVHLGHRTRLWHPRMAPFIHGSRNGQHVIDLSATITHLRRALTAVASMSADDCTFLFLGPSNSQKARIVSSAAAAAGAYAVDGRWIGGTLTNAVQSGQAHKFDYRTPDCVFVIDMARHKPALNEARTLGIPIVGIADTDCDPALLTYPIPGNDDSVVAISLYCQLMRMAILDGRRRRTATSAGAFRGDRR